MDMQTQTHTEFYAGKNFFFYRSVEMPYPFRYFWFGLVWLGWPVRTLKGFVVHNHTRIQCFFVQMQCI